MEDWYTQDLPEDYKIAVSDSGWTTDDLGLIWLHQNDEATRHQAHGQNRFLLMDNHGSHLTFEFIEFCRKRHIVLYCFTPHSTHLLQPLDGSLFQQYKHYHAKAINIIARLGVHEVDKWEFLYQLINIRKKAFKYRTVKSSFKE